MKKSNQKALAMGLAAFGDAVAGIGGVKTSFADALVNLDEAKRKRMEEEAKRAEQERIFGLVSGQLNGGGRNIQPPPIAGSLSPERIAQMSQQAGAGIPNVSPVSVKYGPSGFSMDFRTPDEIYKQQMELGKLQREASSYRTPEQKSELDIQEAARKDFNTYVGDATQSLIALNKIEKYAKNLGDFKTGVGNQLKAKTSMGVAQYAQDPKVTEYVGVLSQELIPAARKLMEEKGPITEFDVARVEKGLGQLTTPLATKIKLLSELKNKVKQALKVKMQTANITQKQFKEKYGELDSLLSGKNVDPLGIL